MSQYINKKGSEKMGRIKELTMFNAIEEFLITYHGNEEVIEDIGVELNNGEVKLIEKEDVDKHPLR